MTWLANVSGDRAQVLADLRRSLDPQRIRQTILGRECMDAQVTAVGALLHALPAGRVVAVQVSGHADIDSVDSCSISVAAPDPNEHT